MTVDFDPSLLVALTVREDIILRLLARYQVSDWVRPCELGGYDSSWHKDVLSALTRRGLVERQARRISRWHWRRFEYRITGRGRVHVARNARPVRRT